MEEKESIHYPLCSLQTYIGGMLDFFIDNPFPRDYSKDNRYTPYILSSCAYVTRTISFFVDGKGASSKVLDHMIKYGSFLFRLCDRDYIIAPCRIMYRNERSLDFDLMIPITIPENMTYMVRLEFSKKMKYVANIMCVLDGEMHRRSV